MEHFVTQTGREKTEKGKKGRKMKPFSFYLVLRLGVVVFVCFLFSSLLLDCRCFAAAMAVPEKISSSCEREVRVYLKAQRFGFYERGRLKFFGTVCTGKKGYETPRGKFKVLMKAQNYYSRKYGGAPMPFAVQFSTGGHFLHVGEMRRQPSSHGCVRLSEKDARRIFHLVKTNDPVIVTD